jgi:hypothetical protein
MNKPSSPITHMVTWGFVSGTILAMLYIAFIMSLYSTSAELLRVFLDPFFWFISIAFGGGAGVILGFFAGLALEGLVYDAPTPFTRADMNTLRYKVYRQLGSVGTIGGFVLSFGFFNQALFSMWFPLIFPPFIAGIAAAYAGHRYLFRLRLWSEKAYGNRKEKLKNSERLEDKLKNDLLYDEEAEGIQDYETS